MQLGTPYFTRILIAAVLGMVTLLGSIAEAAPKPARLITDVCARRQVRGWLYKPESQDTRDSREGKPAMLYTKYKPAKSSLKVYATNGVQIASFKYYKGSEDHGRRFYSGTGTGYSGSQLAAAARRASGSATIYIEGSGRDCAGPINPTTRNDRR